MFRYPKSRTMSNLISQYRYYIDILPSPTVWWFSQIITYTAVTPILQAQSQTSILTELDPCCGVAISVNISGSNIFFFLHSFLFSSTVVEALIRLSDVHDQQVIGFRRKVSKKLKTRGHRVGWCKINFKDKRRLVLMRAVPVPHYVYSTW